MEATTEYIGSEEKSEAENDVHTAVGDHSGKTDDGERGVEDTDDDIEAPATLARHSLS